MSEAFIVRRGGSGGLSANGAVLRITAPTGSTITLTKGGVTVAALAAAKGHTNASDATFADWYYSVSSGNYGSWTVTAARDGETASRTVTVDSAKQYDVFLAYNIYLIRDGVLDSNVNATFGATSGAKSGNNYVITSEGSGSDNYCWLSISSSLGEIESCPALAVDISGMTANYGVDFALVDTDDAGSQGGARQGRARIREERAREALRGHAVRIYDCTEIKGGVSYEKTACSLSRACSARERAASRGRGVQG